MTGLIALGKQLKRSWPAPKSSPAATLAVTRRHGCCGQREADDVNGPLAADPAEAKRLAAKSTMFTMHPAWKMAATGSSRSGRSS
jgi:hypothetical protein